MSRKILTLLIVGLMILTQIQSIHAEDTQPEPDVTAPAYIIMDAKTGTVLYGKNVDQKVYPASTTKIMTILLALKYGDIQKSFTVSDFDVFSLEDGASNIALEPGEVIRMEDALYAAGIPSANDACNGIAEAVGGTYDQFIEMMNKEANDAGAKNTHFANPHGLHDDNHYTTPYDLAMVMRQGIKVNGFTKYLSTDEYVIPATNKHEERELYTHNSLIYNESPYYVEGIQASKTGYTEEANLTLISYAKRGDVELIVAAFGLPDSKTNFQESQNLFNYGFEHYTAQSTLNINIPIPETTLPSNYHFSAKHFYACDIPENVTAYKDTIQYPITAKITLEPISKEAVKGDVIGKLEYKQDGKVLSTTNVYLNTKIFKFDIFDFILIILGIILILLILVIMGLFALRYFVRRKRRKQRAKKRYHY